jgi:repressor LexA
MREIGESFGISSKAVFDHIRALEKKGKISCEQNQPRSLEILDENFTKKTPYRKIPILGNIAAGYPIFSEEHYMGSINVAEDRLSVAAKYFALQVKGDSMINAGILEDDIVVIEKKEAAENGQIVAAFLNDEAVTLKRFFMEQNRVKLKAENSIYPPIYSRNVTILGTLKLLVREY